MIIIFTIVCLGFIMNEFFHRSERELTKQRIDKLNVIIQNKTSYICTLENRMRGN